MTDAPVRLPGIHVYVVAPFAFSVVELPEQMVVLVAVAVTVGVGFTVISTVCVAVHPVAVVVPVTVYVVVVVGETVGEAPVRLPGIHA